MDRKNEEHLRMLLMSRYADNERGWRETQNKIDKTKRAKIVRWRVAASSVAAVAILFLFIFIPRNSTLDSISVVSADPGRNQAMLIMSDGSKVTLTDSSDIKITDVAGAKISVIAGKSINYESESIKAKNIRPATNTIIVPRAGTYSVTLSDGTKVWINSESELSYPVSFSCAKREVTLKGEAYFQVAHDREKPFVVNCNGNSVKVTGTEFNVEFYEEGRMVTTLINGGVTLFSSTGSAALKPGMQGVVSHNEITTFNVNPQLFTSWKDGLFEFDNLTLGEIVKRLSRWYDVEFTFNDKNLANNTFTATFPKDENLSFIVELIEKISSARFAFVEGKVVVSTKK